MINFTKKQLIAMIIREYTNKAILKLDKLKTDYLGDKNNQLAFDWNIAKHGTNPKDLLRQFKNEIKWGMQRFLRGYDDQTFWGLDTHLDEIIRISLRWYIKNRHGSPVMDGWTEENCHEKYQEELKKMLYHFEQSDERWCTEKNEFDDIVDLEWVPGDKDERGFVSMEYKNKSPEAEELRKKWYQRNREIDKYKNDHHKQALEMLVKYYKTLWD